MALSNGKVLVTGEDQPEVCQTAEIFDPSTQNWTRIEDMNECRMLHQLSLLINGKVLASAGYLPGPDVATAILNDAELYDPSTGKWTVTGNLNTERAVHTAVVLANGKVLVIGGAQVDKKRREMGAPSARPIGKCHSDHSVLRSDGFNPELR